jgi:hypothetical protein
LIYSNNWPDTCANKSYLLQDIEPCCDKLVNYSTAGIAATTSVTNNKVAVCDISDCQTTQRSFSQIISRETLSHVGAKTINKASKENDFRNATTCKAVNHKVACSQTPDTHKNKIKNHSAADDAVSKKADQKMSLPADDKDNSIEICTKNYSNKSYRKKIPTAIYRQVIQRAGGSCEYVDPTTNKKCSSKILIQVDHIQPLAAGGTNNQENLRCLCQSHNLLAAQKYFGKAKMVPYV